LAVCIFKADGEMKMKNKTIVMMLALILVLTNLNFILGEVYLFNDVIKDTNLNIVKHHAYYYFEDTSLRGIGKNKDTPVILQYNIESLPYNYTYGVVDWCNVSVTHYHNIYGTNFVAFQGFYGGELLNTTTTTQSYLFTTSASDQITINMRDRDSITASVSCHYTDSRDLFIDNVLIGNFLTLMPSFECDGCTKYSLEELSNLADRQAEVTENELEIYDNIQTIVDWNFQVWLIISWILKIFFLLGGIGLIFMGVYYFYNYLMQLSKEIN
jgi:hypothetical protein